jgi:hypothetical protein
MLRQKTVFIVGAGASCEVGFPTGAMLKDEIAELLDIKYGEYGSRQQSGDERICHYLREATRDFNLNGNINPLLHKCWQIVEVLPTAAISIDNYLDAHQGDAALELCGKLGIVKAILDAEANSELTFNRETGKHFDVSAVQGTWYQALFQQLSENLRRPAVERIFENASFVVFNYDRCVEHVFARLIETYYSIPARDAQYIMDLVPIIHPYGTVGELPWQTEQPHTAVAFGDARQADLLAAARRIRTFSEGQDDSALMGTLHQVVSEAHTLVFLGFSFGRQNLTLMTPEGATEIRRMYGTALGLTPDEQEVIDGEVAAMIRNGKHGNGVSLRLHPEKCGTLLNRVGRALTA